MANYSLLLINFFLLNLSTLFQAAGMGEPKDLVDTVEYLEYGSYLTTNGTFTKLSRNITEIQPHIDRQAAVAMSLCVIFVILLTIVLLNMLIAMMNASYSNITTEFNRGK